jgi:hypothetical protein
LNSGGGDLLVDLAWVTTSLELPQQQYSIQVTDAQGRMVAERDGPLGRWPDAPKSAWVAGEMLRQRVRLQLPTGAELVPYRVYAGLYTSEKVEWLPLTVNGVPDSAGLYLLSKDKAVN